MRRYSQLLRPLGCGDVTEDARACSEQPVLRTPSLPAANCGPAGWRRARRYRPPPQRHTNRARKSVRGDRCALRPWRSAPRDEWEPVRWQCRRCTACTWRKWWGCLLYTSDAADEEDSVDIGGRGM